MNSLIKIDLSHYLENPNSSEAISQCQNVSQGLCNHGAILVKDPRVKMSDNDEFLNILESYFSQTTEKKLLDARPELSYQVGVTPEFSETPVCSSSNEKCMHIINSLKEEDRPQIPDGPDPKWRFFWRIGERPKETKFKELNSNPVLPEGFPEWPDKMNGWGNLMHDAVKTVSEMAAIGFNMEKDTFTSLTNCGPHLLAPTATDLVKYGKKKNTIFAGFHTDLNFLTIHGKSRFPGLFIWDKDGKRIEVKVPDGYLLVQAGMQMEYLTGGQVKAGYHEVILSEATEKAIERAALEGKPLWRISSTLFYHVASDKILKPLENFYPVEKKEMYPEILTGDQVLLALTEIKLKSSKV